MTVIISMIRGINVGGRNSVRMAELSHIYARLGLENAETYIQSGNVIFEARRGNPDTIASRIEAEFERTFGFRASVLNRTREDLHRTIVGNPYAGRKDLDTRHLGVVFLSGELSALDTTSLSPPPGIADSFVLGRREIYLHCPGGFGRSKLTNEFFERRLKTPTTFRNWNTVTTLDSMARMR